MFWLKFNLALLLFLFINFDHIAMCPTFCVSIHFCMGVVLVAFYNLYCKKKFWLFKNNPTCGTPSKFDLVRILPPLLEKGGEIKYDKPNKK